MPPASIDLTAIAANPWLLAGAAMLLVVGYMLGAANRMGLLALLLWGGAIADLIFVYVNLRGVR